MIERVPVPGSRRHHYRLEGGWTQIVQARVAMTSTAIEAAEQAMEQLDDAPQRRARLAEFIDFFTFMQHELGSEFIRRWEKRRGEVRDARDQNVGG